MIKRRGNLVIELVLLTMCASVLPTTIAFAGEKDNIQVNATNEVETTQQLVNVICEANTESDSKIVTNENKTTNANNESDFKFDSSTGTITGYNGTSTVVVIPDKINGVLVTRIKDNAFASKSDLTSITMPDSVTSIGYAAFSDCSSLSSINISKGVTEIQADTFKNCDSLLSVNIPEGVTNIGDCAFSGSGLESVNISNSVTRIGKGAFKGCYLTNVTIPNSVTIIEEDAFRNCVSLESIAIPGSVEGIGKCAFLSCDNLKSVNLLSGVKSIGYQAFGECYGLESITIPDSVTSIDYESFRYCTKLKNITIPNSVTNIGDNAFFNCQSLTDVTIPDSVTTIGKNPFNGCENLKSIIVDNNNKNYISVDGVLFNKQKTKLLVYPEGKDNTTYDIPDGVTSIEDKAFEYCKNLANVSIPKSVNSIRTYAFYSCYNLNTIIVSDSITSLEDYGFDLSDTEIIYYVNSENMRKFLIEHGINKNQITLGNKIQTVNVTDIKLNDESLNLEKGNTIKLRTTVLPSDASNKNLRWRSSNTFIADVAPNGEVKAISEGTVIITCTATDGSKESATCIVTVTKEKSTYDVKHAKLDKTKLNLRYNSVKH